MKTRGVTTTLTREQREELYTRTYREDRVAVRDELLNSTNDYDVVDDLMQEAFTIAWRDLNRYDPNQSSLLTWVVNIAKQVGVDYMRREAADKRANEVLEVYMESDTDEYGEAIPYYDRGYASAYIAEASAALDPALLIEAEDSYAEALHRMPDQMAAVVQMRREGMTNPLIAKELGVSEKRVRNLVHESRDYFRDNPEFNTDNSVCERDGEPLARAARLSQSDVERAQLKRFARRDSAFVMRQIRMRHPDLTPSEWKILYERKEEL